MPRAPQHIVSDDEFEDDDLDELDESEGEEVKSTQKAAKKKGNLLFGALQKPRPVTLNTKQLHGRSYHPWIPGGQVKGKRRHGCSEHAARTRADQQN